MTNSTGGRQNRRIKPTVDTKFHIDYSWWDREGRDLREYIVSLLPEERRNIFTDHEEGQSYDWIDPDTAEVRQIDPLEQMLREASEEFDFKTMPMVDAVFRVFSMNSNTPLSPNELSELVGRPANTILRTFSGARVYQGIRPAVDE